MYSDPIFIFRRVMITSSLLLLLSCGGGGGGGWTILVYLAGDNNLSQAALADLAEMEAVGSTGSVKVVVQIDTFGGPVQRLLVGQGDSTLLEDLEEQNMADPTVLKDFITWGTQQYPADRTALILWNHGDGYQKPNLRTPYGILQDDTDGVDCCLSNLEVRQAIEDAGVHFDLLGFDASQMGQVETAYEFRNVADLLVFSQETGQENGWDYTGILQGLTGQPAMDAEQLAGLIVETYRDFYEEVFYPDNPNFEQYLTISAIELGSTMTDTANTISNLAQALQNSLDDPATVDAIAASRDQAQNLVNISTCNIYADLFDWAKKLQLQPGLDSATRDALEALLVQKDSVVLSEYHGQARPDAKGLSIVFFKDPNPSCSNFDPDYLYGTRPLGFIADTQWNEFLSAYYTEAGLL